MLKNIALGSIGIVLLATPLFASADVISDLQAQVQALLAQLSALQHGQTTTNTSTNDQPDDYGTGTSPTGMYCPLLSTTLQKGSRDASSGGQVSELQTFVTDYYNLDENVVVGGYFGKLTQKYVVQFQTEQGLPAYGIVGSLTRAKIKEVCGGAGRAGLRVISPNGGESIDANHQWDIHTLITGLQSLSIALYRNDQWYAWFAKDLPASGRPDNFEWIHSQSPISDTFPELRYGGPQIFKIYGTGKKADGSGYLDDKSDTSFGFISGTTTPLSGPSCVGTWELNSDGWIGSLKIPTVDPAGIFVATLRFGVSTDEPVMGNCSNGAIRFSRPLGNQKYTGTYTIASTSVMTSSMGGTVSEGGESSRSWNAASPSLLPPFCLGTWKIVAGGSTGTLSIPEVSSYGSSFTGMIKFDGLGNEEQITGNCQGALIQFFRPVGAQRYKGSVLQNGTMSGTFHAGDTSDNSWSASKGPVSAVTSQTQLATALIALESTLQSLMKMLGR